MNRLLLVPSLVLAVAIGVGGCKKNRPATDNSAMNAGEPAPAAPQPYVPTTPAPAATDTPTTVTPAPAAPERPHRASPAPTASRTERTPSRSAAAASSSGGSAARITAKKYVVKKGDTLSEIAKARYGSVKVGMKKIKAANPKLNPDQIRVGQTILLP